jgi:DNA-3-methyladenine glycosylase II
LLNAVAILLSLPSAILSTERNKRNNNREAATMALYSNTGTLAVTPIFDFTQSLEFTRGFSPTSDEQVVTNTSLTKAIMLGERCIAFRVEDAGSVGVPMVRYTLFSEEPLDEGRQKEAAEQISFFLSLQDDLKSFYAIAQQDQDFAPVLLRLHGLRQVKFLTLCEIACWSVLVQHRAMPIARKMKHALLERYGRSITIEGHIYWAFPAFDQLVKVSEAEFADTIKNTRSAHYLYEVVQALSQLDEHFLRTAPYEEAEAALRAIKGIGPWSANFILLRGLGRMERLAADMQPLQDARKKIYQPEVTLEQIQRRYGQYIGYWSFYLRNA